MTAAVILLAGAVGLGRSIVTPELPAAGLIVGAFVLCLCGAVYFGAGLLRGKK